MMLLDDFARPCVLLKEICKQDGESGCITEWADGTEFLSYQALDTSIEARRAEKEGVSSLYSALVDKNTPIEYNDYFRDIISEKTYRVTSNPEEKQSPRSASFSLKYFTAERKALPT